ncbi:MAG: hypothetical protein ISQ46_02090 [Methylophilaceae bacterium]|nr:hypothetical protein [Methylophilaceae bacterium]
MNYQELKCRHQELDKIIEHGYKNYASDEVLKRYKKQKLKIKEIIDKLG